MLYLSRGTDSEACGPDWAACCPPEFDFAGLTSTGWARRGPVVCVEHVGTGRTVLRLWRTPTVEDCQVAGAECCPEGYEHVGFDFQQPVCLQVLPQ